MTLWHPESPQGAVTAQGLIIIGRPAIPRFGAPQGFGKSKPTGDSALVQMFTLSALVQTGTLSSLNQTGVI